MKLSKSPEKNTVIMMSLPIVYIVIGALLLFARGVDTAVFAYLIGAVLIIGGAALVMRYFIQKLYLDFSSYGFSAGILAVLLGIIAMIRVDSVADSLTVCIAICIMLTSIVKLQNSIQLFTVKNKMWIPVLSVAAVFIIASVIILSVEFRSKTNKETFTYIMLLIDGIVDLVITVYMYFSLGRKQQKEMPPILPI